MKSFFFIKYFFDSILFFFLVKKNNNLDAYLKWNNIHNDFIKIVFYI